MTDRSEIDEIRNLLEEQAADAGYPLQFAPFDIWDHLHEAEERAKREAPLLQPWLNATGLAIHILYSLHGYALGVRSKIGTPRHLPC